MMRNNALLLIVAACFASGCNDAGPPAGGSPPPTHSATPAGGPPAPVPPPAAPVQQKASEDLTKKGIAGKEMGKGVLATPASVYLRIPDKTIFLAVQHAMNLFKGEHGALPVTHEAFMRDIIAANNINLPELPDDSKYVYVPEKEELMIEQNPQ